MKFKEKTEHAEDSDDEDVVYETPDFTYLGDILPNSSPSAAPWNVSCRAATP